MGNPKLSLSEIIPNAWFHNPKSSKTHHPITKKQSLSEPQGELPLSPALLHPLSPPRKSYHFRREFSDSPRLDTSRRGRRRKPATQKPSLSQTFAQMVDLQSNSHKSRANSVVINSDQSNLLGFTETGGSVSSFELPTIKIEREKFSDLVKKIGDENKIEQKKYAEKCRPRRANGSLSINVVREESSIASPVCSLKEQGSRSVRRLPNGSPRVRIRIHSPRFARRAQVNSNRVSLSSSPSKKGLSSKSLAVVKSSSDPQKDFRESMVEMIVENNIRATKDLEELLACYLSLNSDQYHDLIIQVFTQIWFDLNSIFKQIKK